jgi:two-component system sensor histidine kinase/response regulator
MIDKTLKIENEMSQKQPTVLIVDDNPNNLKIVALTLRELNYKIVIATNGKSAIDLVKRTNPNLVLLDIMMPEMDGFETCRIIKSDEKNKNLPIIFLTAVNQKSKIVKGFDLGSVDYITKPFNKEELVSRIKTHLELKFTRDKLQATTDHLSDLNEIKNRMFSVIGHDLRSPLGNIKMTLDLLSKGLFEYKSPEYVETIQILMQASEEVSDLLENLLGWAKAQSENLKLYPEKIIFNELIESIYFLFKTKLNNKKINFNIKIPNNLELHVDLYMLKIILRNLISNAIKFTKEGGQITIKTQAHDNNIKISIIDTGIGISEENLVKLFNDKEYYSTYGTNGESGSGLGLKVVNHFINKMNGKLHTSSQISIGSEFIIELPFK